MIKGIKAFGIGRIGRDAEVRSFENGTTLATIRVAFDESYKNKHGEWVSKATWMSCKVWGKYADAIKDKLLKGVLVAVSGTISEEQYTTKEGKQASAYSLTIAEIHILDEVGRPKESHSVTTYNPENAKDHESGAYVPTPGDEDDLPF